MGQKHWILRALVVVLLSFEIGRVTAQTTCPGNVGVPPIPFADVTSFCREIAQAYFTGLTNGTSPTTYGPTLSTTRGERAAFITRTQDSALRRGSRRAALGQFWTPQSSGVLGLTTVGSNPVGVQSDGADVRAASTAPGTLARVRASDGRVLETWTGFTARKFILPAIGSIFVSGKNGQLYRFDPAQAPAAPTVVASSTASYEGIAFDGARIWLANEGGSVSIVTPCAALPFPVVNVSRCGTRPI